MRGLPLVLALSGCTMIPLSTTLALRAYNPLNVDPSGLRANVRVPEMLRVPPRATQLTFNFSPRLIRTPEVFVLEQTDEPSAPLTGRLSITLRVAEADLQRFRQVQADIRALQANGSRDNGSLTLSASPCRTNGSSAGPWPINVYLRVDETGPWLPVARGVDVQRIVPSVCD